MKGYLFSLTAAALLSALVLALVPEGSVRRTVQLGCGLLLALTALSPLLKLDYDAIAKQIAAFLNAIVCAARRGGAEPGASGAHHIRTGRGIYMGQSGRDGGGAGG